MLSSVSNLPRFENSSHNRTFPTGKNNPINKGIEVTGNSAQPFEVHYSDVPEKHEDNKKNTDSRHTNFFSDLNDADSNFDRNKFHLFIESWSNSYTRHVEVLELLELEKPEMTQQEKDAVHQFKNVLDPKKPTQAQLINLTIEQLRIFFPIVYVEASHEQNQLCAFHEKEITYCPTVTKKEDDNVLMMKGYKHFQLVLKDTLDNKALTEEDKKKSIEDGIKKLVEILLSTKFDDIHKFTTSEDMGFELYKEDIYNPRKETLPDNNSPSLTKQLRYLKTKIRLDLSKRGFLYVYGAEIGSKFCHENSMPTIKRLISEFSKELVDADKKRDMRKIFGLTSDFQWIHMLPNANGRTSQIIRDCFAMHYDQLPYSALTSMSHYLYLFDNVNEGHLKFMQELTRRKLCDITEESLSVDGYRYSSIDAQAELEKLAENNPAIKFDVDNFVSETLLYQQRHCFLM